MEEGAKKSVLIAVIVVCLAAAGVIAYKSLGGGGGGGGSAASTKMWVKCNNPKCGTEYQITLKEYNDFIQNLPGGPRAFAMAGGLPMKCTKCGEMSVFEAIKCEKCGKVFFPSAVEGQYDDKCPGCGFSKKEQAGKATPSSK